MCLKSGFGGSAVVGHGDYAETLQWVARVAVEGRTQAGLGYQCGRWNP